MRFALKAALSERLGVHPEQIVLGNGSNDVLELATQAFLRAGDHAVYSQYAFVVYTLATQARGALGIEVAAKDHAHDLDAMRAAVTPRTRIAFIANRTIRREPGSRVALSNRSSRACRRMSSSCWTRRTTSFWSLPSNRNRSRG
jgi:hypothetical protein